MLSTSSNGYDTLRSFDTTPVSTETLQAHNQQLADSLEDCLREIELLKLELHQRDLRIEELEALTQSNATDAATASMSCLTLESDPKGEFSMKLGDELGDELRIPAELMPDFLGFSLQEFLDEN
ncbi:hypothetical protein CJU89_6354 [Yarrowia sp. B02]|nr:hypothetical protein CJU89_6354 [Yarrowia sp. B02]